MSLGLVLVIVLSVFLLRGVSARFVGGGGSGHRGVSNIGPVPVVVLILPVMAWI